MVHEKGVVIYRLDALEASGQFQQKRCGRKYEL